MVEIQNLHRIFDLEKVVPKKKVAIPKLDPSLIKRGDIKFEN